MAPDTSSGHPFGTVAVKYADVYARGYEAVPALRDGLGRYFSFYNDERLTSRSDIGPSHGVPEAAGVSNRRSSPRTPSAGCRASGAKKDAWEQAERGAGSVGKERRFLV